MQVQKVIEQLGYSANEAKVYIATLALGEAHVSDIATKVKLPRTSVQAIVEKLHKEGVMNFYVQRRYKYWVAESPEHLLANYKKREEAMRNALPELTALRRRRSKGHGGAITERSIGALRMLADASIQPVLIADESVEIVYVNTPWEEQFGYSLEDVHGQNPRILQSGKTPREVYQRMWGSLKEGKMFQSDEIVDKRKDGTFFNLLTTIIPIERADGKFYIQILDDITAKKRAEKLGERFLKTLPR